MAFFLLFWPYFCFAQLNIGSTEDVTLLLQPTKKSDTFGWVTDTTGLTSSLYSKYNTRETLACGISLGSTDWYYKGVTNFRIIMCHIYDWNLQKNLDVHGSSFPDSAMCSEGYYITEVSAKTGYSSVTIDNDKGMTALRFKCKNPMTGATMQAQVMDQDSTSEWTSWKSSRNRYLCGADLFEGEYWQEYLFNRMYEFAGVCEIHLRFCEYNCNAMLIFENDIDDQSYSINFPSSIAYGGTRDYRQTTATIGNFQDHFSFIGVESECSISECQAVKGAQLLTFSDDNDIWAKTLPDLLTGAFIEVNTDPIQESSSDIYFKCYIKNTANTGNWIQSNTFNIQISCPNDISVIDNNLALTQTMEVSSSTQPFFQFNSFLTQTKACPAQYYEISSTQSSVNVPTGIQDGNPICESQNSDQCSLQSGVIYSNTHQVIAIDGENPNYFDFKIKVFVQGGNTVWFPSELYRLIVACPSTVSISQSFVYTKDIVTYLGATGLDAIFTFSQYVTSLPKCQNVISYEISYQAPSESGLSYPSQTCSIDPCNLIDIDTSATRTINFKINYFTDTGATGQSDSLSVLIASTAQTPSITQPSLPNNTFLLDSDAHYFFTPFTCSTASCILSYSLSSSQSSFTPIPGLGSVTLSSNPSFSVDTSSLGSFSLYIFCEVIGLPSVYLYSSLITISVTCGSETITQSIYQFDHMPYGPSEGSVDFSDFVAWFGSNKQACPIKSFVGVARSSRIRMEEQVIKVRVDAPFREKIEVYGQTESVMSQYPTVIEFTVCGNEIVSGQAGVNEVIVQQGESYQISFSSWFNCYYEESDCHSGCCELNYQLFAGTCGGTGYEASKYTFDASNKAINVISTHGFELEEICLRASSVGNKYADLTMKIEICGTETISIQNKTEISQVFPQNSIAQTFIIASNFISTRENCQVQIFKLIDTSGSEYTGGALTLSGSAGNLQITVNTNQALNESLYLSGYSLSLNSHDSIPLNIRVCGYESLTTRGSLSKTYRIQSGNFRIYGASFENFFINNDTQCAIDSFALYDANGLNIIDDPLLISYIHLDFSTISINTIISDADFQEFLNQGYISDGNVILNLAIQATTIGKIKAQIPLAISIIRLSSSFNFPPFFEQDLLPIYVNTSLPFTQKLPKIIDIEDEEVSVSFLGVPDYLQYIFDGNNYVAKIVEQKKENEEIKVQIILKDASGNQEIYTQLIKIEVKEVFDFPDFYIPQNCRKVQKVVSYRQFCKNDNYICENVFKNSIYLENYENLEDATYDSEIEVLSHQDNGEDIQSIIFLPDWQKYSFYMTLHKLEDTDLSTMKKALLEWYISIHTISWNDFAFECSYTQQYEKNLIDNIFSVDNYQALSEDLLSNEVTRNSSTNNITQLEISWQQPQTSGEFPTFSHKFYQDPSLDKMLLEIQFSQEMSVPDQISSQEVLIKEMLTVKVRSVVDPHLEYLGTFVDSNGQYMMELQIIQNTEDYQILKDLEFSWSINNFYKNRLLIQMKFKEKYLISQTPYGYDKLVFQFHESEKFASIGANVGKMLQGESLEEVSISIKPIYDMAQANSIKQIFDAATKAAAAVGATALAFGIFAGAPLQKLWSLVQSQQLSINLILLNVLNIPGNAYIFQDFLSIVNFRNKIKSLGDYYSNWFIPTESLMENNERLGYKGTNFIELTGSLLVYLVVTFIVLLIFNSLNQLFKNYYLNANVRKIATIIYPLREKIVGFIAKLFTEGYLEFCIPLLISLFAFEAQNMYDTFAKVAQYIMIIVFALPFIILRLIYQNFDQLNDEVFKNNYGILYKDLRTRNFLSAIKTPIFMLRRIIFAFVIIFVPDFLQFFIILNTNLAYTCYILHSKPFTDPDLNWLEVFNEVFVQIFTYCYMFFKQSLQPNETMGTVYIMLYFFNFLVNFNGLLENILFKQIPRNLSKIKKWWGDRQYFSQKQMYFLNKQKIAKKYPQRKLYQYMYQESKKLEQRDKEMQKFLKDQAQFDKEVKWMKLNYLPYEHIEGPKLPKQQVREVYTSEDLKEEQKLPIENMLYKSFPHNESIGDRMILPPYNELDYIEFVDKLVQGNIQPNELERLRKIIMLEKRKKLYRWIQKRRFMVVNIQRDGNCGPRSIAVRVTGNQNNHDLIRSKLCTGPMSVPGTWFTDLEFQLAANVFKIPIIIFSPLHKTALFDCLFEPFSGKVDSEEPLYILHNGEDHYEVLIHKSQRIIRKFLKERGCEIKPFAPPPPEDKKARITQLPQKLEDKLKQVSKHQKYKGSKMNPIAEETEVESARQIPLRRQHLVLEKDIT